jgi:SAM-dependent methyltransferase
MTGDFSHTTFTAPEERCRRLSDVVLRFVDAGAPLRLLEIGCGTGNQLADLARRLPRARLVGVDVSAPNIEIANRMKAGSAESERLSFAAADYLALPFEPGQVILSDSTLHLIEGPSRALFSKVRDELTDQGIVVFTMPRGCPFNHLLWSARRLFRLARCRWTDQLIFTVGRLLSRGMSGELLRERVGYMYLLPHRHYNLALRRLLLEDLGFSLVHSENWPLASLAQPKHVLVVLRKTGGRVG